MHNNRRSSRPQRHRIRQRSRAVHAYDFFNQLTDDDLLEVVDQQLPVHRERLFPPTTTLAMFMAQTLNPDASCQATIDRHAVERVANDLQPCSTATGAYCKAHQRLPAAMVQAVLRHTGTLLASQALDAWRWHGRAVKLVDGTTITMPDTAENQARYPQSRTQKPGLGFPISRVVALMCLGTGAVLDTAMGPQAGKQSSEHALFHTLLGSVVDGDVLLGDRYYCSYVMIALLQARGADVVFQLHQRRITDFRKGQRLGRMDHVVVWNKPKVKPRWLSQEGFEAIPDTLHVRETHVGKKILVSTLLSSTQASAQELKKLYAQRWNVELDLRHIKTTLGLERMTCKTPAMNEKQWWVGLLAYNLIRLLMLRSAKLADVLPRQLSFKHSMQLWLAWSQRGLPADQTQIQCLLMLMAQKRVGNRPGRIEPRVVKRRPKPFPLLTQPRSVAREKVRQFGHPKRLK
jgi:hypothetical protein